MAKTRLVKHPVAKKAAVKKHPTPRPVPVVERPMPSPVIETPDPIPEPMPEPVVEPTPEPLPVVEDGRCRRCMASCAGTYCARCAAEEADERWEP